MSKALQAAKATPVYLYVLFACLLWVLPFALILYNSLTTRTYAGTFFAGLANFQEVSSMYWRGLRTSLILVPCVVLLNLFLATPAAYVLSRTVFRGRRAFFTFFSMTMFVPDVVSGLALLIAYRLIYNLYDSFFGLLFALSIVSFPMMLIPLSVAFRGLDPDYEEAAVSLGANWLRTFLHVIVPLVGPGIFAGVMLGFIWAMNCFLLPFFVVGHKYVVAAFAVYSDIRWYGLLGSVAAEAVVLQLISFLIIVFTMKFIGTRYLKGVVWV